MSSEQWNDLIDRNHDQQPRNHEAEDDEFGEFEGFEAAQQFYADHLDLQAEAPGAAGAAGGAGVVWGRFPDNVPERRGASSGAGALQPDLLPTRAGLHASCPMTDSGGSVGESSGAEGGGGNGDSGPHAVEQEEPNRRGPLPDISSSGSDIGQRVRAPLPDIQGGESDAEPRLAAAGVAATGGVVARRNQTGRAATGSSSGGERRGGRQERCNGGTALGNDARDPTAQRPTPADDQQERLSRQVDALRDQVSQLSVQLADMRRSEDVWRQAESRHIRLQQQPIVEDAAGPRGLTEERLQAMLREASEQQRALLDERLATFGAEVVRLVESSVASVLERVESGRTGGASGGSPMTADATVAAVRDTLRVFADDQRQRESERLRMLTECVDSVLAGTRGQLSALLRPPPDS